MPTPDSDLNMAVIALFDGGVVNNANIAARLARLILEPLIGAAELAANLPLRVEDRGDNWAIQGSREAPGRPGACDLDIRKRDAAVLVSGDRPARDLLCDPALAEAFAAAALENANGDEELRRQMPLVVSDQGEIWRVRGSHNADRAVEGPGPFHLEVQKRDARVLDMWSEWVLHTPPDVQALLRASAKRPPSEG